MFGKSKNLIYLCAPIRRGARVVEEARLESVYTPKGYHEFESRSLRGFNCCVWERLLWISKAAVFWFTDKCKNIILTKGLGKQGSIFVFK